MLHPSSSGREPEPTSLHGNPSSQQSCAERLVLSFGLVKRGDTRIIVNLPRYRGMQRRDVITLLVGATAWPIAASVQHPVRERRIGVLMSLAQNDRQGQRYIAAFLNRLEELGWKPADGVHIDVRWGAADLDRIHSYASELVNSQPNVILAQSALALRPVQRATATIPIVFVQIVDPVGSGFVASLDRPGANTTGFADAEFALSGKMLEVLKEIAPRVMHAAVIHNPVQVPQIAMWHAIEAVAPSLGVVVSAATPRDAAEIQRVVEALGNEPASGVIVLPNPITNLHSDLLIALMARYRLPAVYSYPYLVSAGGLVSYGVDPAGQFRQAALYVDRILRGTKPADLPVEQPTKLELAINLKTAKALGLEVPATLLVRADDVVE
jgi:putative tryptophan/tyrosine transport system substrate-binding protein